MNSLQTNLFYLYVRIKGASLTTNLLAIENRKLLKIQPPEPNKM